MADEIPGQVDCEECGATLRIARCVGCGKLMSYHTKRPIRCHTCRIRYARERRRKRGEA